MSQVGNFTLRIVSDVLCNATYNKMTHLRVSSTLGRAVHFRVNTDAGDWEHPGPECGSVEKQSLREQNE